LNLFFVLHNCGGGDYYNPTTCPKKFQSPLRKSPQPKPNLNSPNKVIYFEIGSDVKSLDVG
jgi:hypothetical protein